MDETHISFLDNPVGARMWASGAPQKWAEEYAESLERTGDPTKAMDAADQKIRYARRHAPQRSEPVHYAMRTGPVHLAGPDAGAAPSRYSKEQVDRAVQIVERSGIDYDAALEQARYGPHEYLSLYLPTFANV